MMKHSIFFLFLVILFGTNQAIGQGQIEYGSNKGQYIDVFDCNLYYEVYGEGTPLLLLHGGLGTIADFKEVIPELSKHFKVIAVDSPGHGRSESIDSLSYQIMADYFVEMIKVMNLDSVYVIGYSDGAISGLLAAHDKPDKIKRIVFGGGALNPDASKPGGVEILKSISPQTLHKSFIEEYKRKSPNPDKWNEFIYDSKEMWLQDVWIPEYKLKEINSQTLIILGDRDEFIPIQHGVKIYNAIPKSEFCVLPNTSHNIYNKPDIVNDIMIYFLTKE